MWGAGTFTTQNKLLAGAYINFVSASRANAAISDRGIVALVAPFNWGAPVTEMDYGTFLQDSKKLFGYDASADELMPIRDVFKHSVKVIAYRINASGAKATSSIGTAKYEGTRGNDLKVVVANSVDVSGSFDVTTFLDAIEVDRQTVASAADLVDNGFVAFNKEATLSVSAGITFSGGTNGVVNGASYTTAMNTLATYTFNAIGFATTEDSVLNVIKSWTKRMREEVGAKFQAVICGSADYEGIVSVETADAVPWVTGAIGGCNVNKSNTNLVYDGESTVKSDYTHSELEAAIKGGKFVFHKVGETIRVLEDINSLVTFTPEKSSDFSNNQVIRVLDTIATTTANIFCTTYLGKVQNNADGRVSLKAQLVSMCNQLQNIGAIENFTTDDIEVAEGNLKKAVSVNMAITPVVAMTQLYAVVAVN